uniref:mucin-4 isoform X2 n=1 Tax=Semicossyphus pulcher TaxID=241346 RepID=UPI0037E76E8A
MSKREIRGKVTGLFCCCVVVAKCFSNSSDILITPLSLCHASSCTQFHCRGNSAALKQAGSESELCQADSLGSAGSSSTLASSVIEVEAERTEPGVVPQLRLNQAEEEEEEEELTPLSPPPTLSITEEILEFINQSRAREGLTAIHTEAKEQVLDQPKDSQSSSNTTNFTCPLPPVARPSSPEQRPAIQQEQERIETENDITLPSQTSDSGEENGLYTEKTSDELQEASDETSPGEKGLEAGEETQVEVVEKEKEEEKTRDNSKGGSIIAAPSSDLHPSISVEEEQENSSSCDLPREVANTEATSSSHNPDVHEHRLQRRHPPTRGSHLTKRDKKIIEKIRSYYEAAAEAEEDEEEEEEEQGEGVASRRRNSFSQIPSGLVKESVSRFDVSENQGEPEYERVISLETAKPTDRETDRRTEPCSPTNLMSSTTAHTADTENNGQTDKPISSLASDAEGPIKSLTASVMQDKETLDQVGLNNQSNPNRPVGEETETLDKNGKACIGLLEEGLKERQEARETSVVDTVAQGGSSLQGEGLSITKQYKSMDETAKTSTGNQAVMNVHKTNEEGQTEQSGSNKAPSKPLPPTEQCQKTEVKTQSTLTRTKQELTKNSGNLEGVPSQIKVGRWSRHSRIVTANRALFEGMASDIAGIRLFEASPVVDPLLMENSERILSKVQTLAEMYSAKASTMKVPLHQKRASVVRNQSSVSGRPSALSTQTQTNVQTKVQSQTEMVTPIEYRQQTKYQMETRESNTNADITHKSQTPSGAKVQSQSITQPAHTKNQMCRQAQTHYQSQSQTKTYSKYQTTTMSREDHVIQEKRMLKRTESLKTDFKEPLLFGHVVVKEQLTPACHHQTNGIILSRPRDFISVMTKERDSSVAPISGDIFQTSSIPGESVSTLQRDQSSTQAQTNSCKSGYTLDEMSLPSTTSSHHQRRQPEDHRATEFRDNCSNSSTGRAVALKQDGEVISFTEEKGKREGMELNAGWPVHSVMKESTSVNIITQQALYEPSLSAQSTPQWGISNNTNELEKYKQDLPAARVPEYKSTGHNDNEDMLTKGVHSVNAGPEYLVSTGPVDGEASPRSQIKFNETQCVLIDSSSQPRMTLQGSRVNLTEEPPYYRSSGERALQPPQSQPSHMTFEPSILSHTITETEKGGGSPNPLSSAQNSESNPTQPWPPSVQSIDCLPTFTSQRPPDLPTATGNQALSRNVRSTSPSEHSYREPDQQRSRSPCIQPISSLASGCPASYRPSSETAIATHGQDRNLTTATSGFIPSFRHHSPSPVRALHSSSSCPVGAPPCSSPFGAVPGSSPIPLSPEDSSRAPPCFSPTISSGRGSSIQDPPSSSLPYSTFTHSSTTSSSERSSAFTRSLAASCISQSISQSMARKNTALQEAPLTVNQSPSSHLRQRSPSPKLPPSQQGSKDGYHHPRCTPSSPRSTCPSPYSMQSPPSLSQHCPSPSMSPAHHQPSHYSSSARPSFIHSKIDPTQNANTNNNNNLACISTAISDVNNASNRGWSVSSQRAPLNNGSTNATVMQQTHDPLWSGSHNRVARPFSASEPNSRVQSPSPSPTASSFIRLCSPPPQHNYSSPMANKPPHPRGTRVGSASSHNPLGLTLDLPRATSTNSAFGQSSRCPSPQILSPPPIGVSVNVWTNNVAAPQPRNPTYAPSPPSFSSSLASHTPENSSCPSSSYSLVSLRSPKACSSSAPQTPSQTLRRSLSSTLAERPPSPARSNHSGLRRSWTESSRRSLGLSGSGRGSFDQQESCPTSPRSGWSSYGSSPFCLSPRAGLQSPLSPSRLTPAKGSLGGQHFTSVPWPDVRELSHKYNGSESLDTSATSPVSASSPVSSLSHTLLSSPAPSDSQTEWGDTELEEGHCRSQLICAYVARPSREQNLPSSSMVLSSSDMTSPSLVPYQHHNYQSQVKPQPQVQIDTTTHAPSISSTLASSPSPLPFAHSLPSKQGNQKSSYATTVNLQIAGSGRITSFSTAQVSLTQTLQGGPGQGQVTRRVSINGLSHLPSPLYQNCNRL